VELPTRPLFAPKFCYVRLNTRNASNTHVSLAKVNAENDRETDGYSAIDYLQSVILPKLGQGTYLLI